MVKKSINFFIAHKFFFALLIKDSKSKYKDSKSKYKDSKLSDSKINLKEVIDKKALYK